MNHSARRTGPALEAHYQFMLWLIPTVKKFPRAQKFLLGDRIEAAALDVREALIEATSYRPGRYVEILVHDPKERVVFAAFFREFGGPFRSRKPWPF